MSRFSESYNPVSNDETRILTPMQAILDSSFGTLTCPTCDGLFTHKYFLESHYLSEENNCTEPIPSINKRISGYILLYFKSGISAIRKISKTSTGLNLSHSSVDITKHEDKKVCDNNESVDNTIEESPLTTSRVTPSLVWKLSVLILFIYVLYKVSLVYKF